MKMKHLISMMLILILFFTLTACQGGQTTASPTQTTKSEGGQTTGSQKEETTAVDISEFVTVSHLSLGDKPSSGQYEVVKAEWDKYLKDKLNAALEIQYIGWTDYLTQYNLLLATGEDLDMINTASDWLEMWPNAQRGAFMDIKDLLPIYAPMTWETIPDDHWAEVSYKDQIISIPEDMYTQWINHGFMYRGDWADQFNIGEIKSWDDFGRYLQAVKDNLSDQGVIPFDLAGASNMMALYDGWIMSKSMLICIDPVPSGLAYGKSDTEWDKVVSRFAVQDDGTDLLLDFAKKMKEWGDAGYWREDVLNNTADGWVQFKAGLNGTRQHHTNTFIYAHGELEREIPGADLRYFPWSDESGNLVRMSITHGATAIGAKCENPERTLMVYDLIRNDETMYRLFNWGIEGVQYIITEDGKRDLPEGYTNEQHGFSSNFWGGRMDKFELKYPNATMIENWEEWYAHFDSMATDYRYGRFVFDKSPVESEIAACSEVINSQLPAICVGKAGDPDAAVAKFRSSLELAGIDTILTEAQRQMDEFKASIS